MSRLTGQALVAHRAERLASLQALRTRQAAELAETDDAIAECIVHLLNAVEPSDQEEQES